MHYQFAQHCFEFYFQVDYPVAWAVAVADVHLGIYGTDLSGHQTRFAVRADGVADHDTGFAVFSLEITDCDTVFHLAAVSRCDTAYVVDVSSRADHDVCLVVQAAGVGVDHATRFVVREEDTFTN